MAFIYFQMDNRTNQYLKVRIVGEDVDLSHPITPNTAMQVPFSEDSTPSRVARGFDVSFRVLADANDQTGTPLDIQNGHSPMHVDFSGHVGPKVRDVIARFTLWAYTPEIHGANVKLEIVTRP